MTKSNSHRRFLGRDRGRPGVEITFWRPDSAQAPTDHQCNLGVLLVTAGMLTIASHVSIFSNNRKYSRRYRCLVYAAGIPTNTVDMVVFTSTGALGITVYGWDNLRIRPEYFAFTSAVEYGMVNALVSNKSKFTRSGAHTLHS